MTGLATQQVLLIAPSVGCVVALGCNIGQTLVFTSPFVFALVIIAQAHPLTLLGIVGKGQADG